MQTPGLAFHEGGHPIRLYTLALVAIAVALVVVIAACGGGGGSGGDRGIDEGLEIGELPCGPADAMVRTSDGNVGCTEVSETYVETTCGAGLRVVFDFADPEADPRTNFTVSCAALDESAEDVFGALEPIATG